MTSTRLFLTALCLISLGCGRSDKTQGDRGQETIAAAPKTAALSHSLDLKALNHFSGFSSLNQASVTASGDQLVIVSSGNDPQVALPSVNVTGPSQFAARIEMTSPIDTLVQLYYTTAATPAFAAENVATASIKAGRATILLEINDPNFSGTLRFDPGQGVGEYVVHSFELFSSESLSVAENPTPGSPTP